jgi:hypothetical protein
MHHHIARRELFQAEAALLVAVLLQILVWRVNHGFSNVQFFIILAELAMLSIVAFSSSVKSLQGKTIYRIGAVSLLILMSSANLSSLIIVLDSLITGTSALTGMQLLSSAIAIFATNIIVFALWYWEIDSPGLTRRRWSAKEKDFQFTQQDLKKEFPDWKPEFTDYFYVSLTNAINFAAADARPLTHSAKLLMSSQALISVFTLALVLAKSVSILG